MKVRIHIVNRQKTMDGEETMEEIVESVTEGQYDVRADKIYVRYEEKLAEDTPPVRSCLKLYEGHMVLTRSGGVKVTMHFENGMEHKTGYITPYGTFAMKVRTGKMDFKDNEKELMANVEYELDLEDARYASCQMQITVHKMETLPGESAE